jgi:hypothetical protein
MSVDVTLVEQQDPRLGRQAVHDDRSRRYALSRTVDRSTWRDKAIRLYDPWPNPNQRVGCCTGVAKCSQMNAVGNRRKGVVLGMKHAEAIYSDNTKIDPWPGTWPPEDTGSSGLASAKTAQAKGIGGTYRWLFGGGDEVVQTVMDGDVVSVGTWWYWDMFSGTAGRFDGKPIVTIGGGQAGGHQYVIRGYDEDRDLVLGRCWWGAFRDFWMKRMELDALLRDGGDAHVQERT